MFVSKTSWRRLEDMSWKRLEDILKTSWRHVFKTTSRRLQRNNFLSSKTFSRRLQEVSQDVFKMSSRRLGRRKIVTLKTFWRCLQDILWRRLQDVLNTNKCLLGLKCYLIGTDVFKTSQQRASWCLVHYLWYVIFDIFSTY